ncbi:hypothetical protein bpr_I2915 [Butyrivibrio proteoclasticus B316]|uniref:Uncharacterized protein n=1 Tax=Butyrivibrio proteoclasticus (strain ATCC 51982 / DSM 14932 / B316) TaxID=515622 RepID=E0RVW3_BUTPB|nr:hypothetical protein [Butyrivibrio proteoclasticus]ADL35645.1 hypothetical protein bpr_I2915 [Butyrivibrio proteoclasticus B316]
MSIGINTNNYSNMYQSDSSWGESASISKSEESGSSDMYRKLEYNRWKQEKSKSVVDQSVSYADQLRAMRKKTKDISNEKKKLQYNFKKISSQIVRSKNSVSARKAVQAAKREIARLKRLKGSGEYDDEELQLAIDHAKSMEQVAKKKVSHLEQEELVERAHRGFGAALEEIQDKKKEDENENPEELDDEKLEEAAQGLDVDDEYVPEADYQYELEQAIEQQQYAMEQLMENNQQEYEELMAETSSDAMSEMMDEMSQAMEDMMEDLDLTELSQTLYAPDPDMSEDDLKMLKIKHRAKEMKEIAEADKEYLKGIMEHEKQKAENAGSMSTGATSAGSATAIFGNNKATHITPVISMPGAAMGGSGAAPTLSDGGFSVCI